MVMGNGLSLEAVTVQESLIFRTESDKRPIHEGFSQTSQPCRNVDGVGKSFWKLSGLSWIRSTPFLIGDKFQIIHVGFLAQLFVVMSVPLHYLRLWRFSVPAKM
jgi:hypothetical protein